MIDFTKPVRSEGSTMTDVQRIIRNLERNPIPGRRNLTQNIIAALKGTPPVAETSVLKCPGCGSLDVIVGDAEWEAEFPEAECNDCGYEALPAVFASAGRCDGRAQVAAALAHPPQPSVSVSCPAPAPDDETYYSKGKDANWLAALSDEDLAEAVCFAAQDLNDTGLGDDLDKWMPFQAMMSIAADRIKKLITAQPSETVAAVERAFDEIRELNMSGRDENGHRWANSDLIDQTVTEGLVALRALKGGA